MYNVRHPRSHQMHRLSIVSFNGRYSEFLLADYTGALWYLLRLSYTSSYKLNRILVCNWLTVRITLQFTHFIATAVELLRKPAGDSCAVFFKYDFSKFNLVRFSIKIKDKIQYIYEFCILKQRFRCFSCFLCCFCMYTLVLRDVLLVSYCEIQNSDLHNEVKSIFN